MYYTADKLEKNVQHELLKAEKLVHSWNLSNVESEKPVKAYESHKVCTTVMLVKLKTCENCEAFDTSKAQDIRKACEAVEFKRHT